MEQNLLEFWGNFFTGAAEGQKFVEDMTVCMRRSFSAFEAIPGLFRKVYGLDKPSGAAVTDYFAVWTKARNDFDKCFTEYLALMGVVPRDQHLALIKKYEDLKEKSDSQAETIEHLRMLLSAEKKMEHDEITGKFQGLVQQQADQFQKLMESFRQAFQTDHKRSAEKKRSRAAAKTASREEPEAAP
jgi:hypothetical protein